METIIIHPDRNKIKAIKAVLKALDISFEVKNETTYNADFVAKIKRGEDDIQKGKITKVTLDEIWKLS